MSSMSISGLASGLDTATIINQLMQLEAIPQTKLRAQLSSAQSTVTTLQELNARVAALTTKAAEQALPGAWSPLAATSSHEGVTLTTSSGVAAGAISFTVDQTALAHRLTFSGTAGLDDQVTGAGTTVTLTVGGEATTIDTGDGTMRGLVDALNAAGTGVRATALRLDDGSHRLTLTSVETGAASAFTLTDADGDDLLGGAGVRAGRDAAITIGPDTVHSATNTFTGLLPGVDLTVSAQAVGHQVEVDVTADSEAVAGQAKAFVDQVNAVLAEIDRLTAYDATAQRSGSLAGESVVRALRQSLTGAIFPTDGSTMAAVGIQTDRSGRLVFDEAVFAAAHAADPAAVTAAFAAGASDGFAARIEAVGKTASDRFDGTLTTAITGRNSAISRMETNIDSWDQRLELRRTSLTRQFTALEVALSTMQSQSNWLAGQLASLTANNL